jgi:membrane-bound serine protease (ClpP class)
VSFTELSFSEGASKWLLKIAGILSGLVLLAIVFTLFQGPGVITIIGGIALVLVILINVTADHVNGFPIFLVLLGVGLLAAEIFVIPGFGVAGIAGIVAMAVGFLYLATGSTWGETGGMDSDVVMRFALQFTFTLIVVFVLMLTMSRFLPKVGPARRMVLQPSGASGGAAPLEADARMPVLGAVGRARSPLRPAGSAEFDGRLADVVSEGGFIAADTAVEIVALEGERITVRARADARDGASS